MHLSDTSVGEKYALSKLEKKNFCMDQGQVNWATKSYKIRLELERWDTFTP